MTESLNQEELTAIMNSDAYRNPQNADYEKSQKYVAQGFKNLYPDDDRNEHPENYYVWSTVGDHKVRDSHAARDGEVFSWSDPPEGGHPGEDYGCRCTAEEYIPPEPDAKKNIWPYPLKTDPAQKLKFNGKSLQLIENRKIIKEWPAVSGRSGYQDPKHQSLKNTGPIPAGIYAARLDQLQGIEDINLWQKIIGNVGRGTWPGLENSWGNYRV